MVGGGVFGVWCENRILNKQYVLVFPNLRTNEVWFASKIGLLVAKGMALDAFLLGLYQASHRGWKNLACIVSARACVLLLV